MATIAGKNGVVKGGTDGSEAVIGEVKSFSLNLSSDTAETTVMGDASRSFESTLKSFSGTVEVNHSFDAGDNQDEFAVGSTISLLLYPEGTSSGSKYYDGQAIVTGRDVSSSFDGIVEASYSFQGTGDLSESTEP